MSMQTSLGEWLREYPRSHTRRAYSHDVEEFFAWCSASRVDPAKATRAEANDYRDFLVDSVPKLAPATIDRKIAACKSFYAFCVASEEIVASPFDLVRRMHQPGESRTPWPDRGELSALLKTAQKVDATGRDLILISLLGLNGLRVSETLRADVADLGNSGGHRTLQVTRKGAKPGLVPLAPAVAIALDAYLDGRTTGPLIARLHSHGGLQHPIQPISQEAARKRLRHLAELAGVNPELTPHSLRHGFVTQALEDGSPLHVVQLAVGHSSPTTTMKYQRGGESLGANPTFGLAEGLLRKEAV